MMMICYMVQGKLGRIWFPRNRTSTAKILLLISLRVWTTKSWLAREDLCSQKFISICLSSNVHHSSAFQFCNFIFLWPATLLFHNSHSYTYCQCNHILKQWILFAPVSIIQTVKSKIYKQIYLPKALIIRGNCNLWPLLPNHLI